MPEVIVTRPKPEDNRDKRIEDLKRRAEELCDGQMELGKLDDCPAEMEESFWKHVVDYEEAPSTTHFHQLEMAGVSLPSPDSLNEQEVTAKLWEVIHKLALLRVFIEQTDHLSDRELYRHLWTESLREETKMLPATANSAWHIQPLGGCSEEDNRLYLKYYADDASRQHWHMDFPDDPLPVHENLPYDRDRLLPKPDYRPPVSREPN
jgi:hypothetical protein